MTKLVVNIEIVNEKLIATFDDTISIFELSACLRILINRYVSTNNIDLSTTGGELQLKKYLEDIYLGVLNFHSF